MLREAYTTGFDAIKFQLEKQRDIYMPRNTLCVYLEGYTRDANDSLIKCQKHFGKTERQNLN